MDCSMPGFPVHHQLPELTQTHVHWVSEVIQPSHLLSSPSPPAFNLSQHQGLIQWVSSSHQVAEVLHPEFVLIRYGKTYRHEKYCHIGRSCQEVLDSKQGYTGKHQGWPGGWRSEGQVWVWNFRAVFMGDERQAWKPSRDWLVWIILVGPGL